MRPPQPFELRVAESQRQMRPGTLGGTLRSASPVRELIRLPRGGAPEVPSPLLFEWDAATLTKNNGDPVQDNDWIDTVHGLELVKAQEFWLDPEYVAAAVNGEPGVEFSDGASPLRVTLNEALPVDVPFVVFLVGKFTSTLESGTNVTWVLTGGTWSVEFLHGQGFSDPYVGGAADDGTDYLWVERAYPTVDFLYQFDAGAGGASLQINDGTVDENTGGAFAPADGLTQLAVGAFPLVVCHFSALVGATDQQVADRRAALGARFGVAV